MGGQDKKNAEWKRIKAKQDKKNEETRRKHESKPKPGQTSGKVPKR